MLHVSNSKSTSEVAGLLYEEHGVEILIEDSGIPHYIYMISESDVLDMLTSLDSQKARGINSVNFKLLHALPLFQIICHLFS